MKKKLMIFLFILTFHIVFCQIYTSVDNYGWNSGDGNSFPYFIDLDDDCLIEGFLGKPNGTIYYYEQDLEDCLSFNLITNNFCEIDVGDNSYPTIFDIDNDGLYDLIIGNSDGYLYHYEQESFTISNFIFISDDFNNIGDVGSNASPTFFDIDNDGLVDLIIGEKNGNLNHWEQTSTNSYGFQYYTDQFNDILFGDQNDTGLWLGGDLRPVICDFDNDNLLDLVVGTGLSWNKTLHYKQEMEYSYTFTYLSSLAGTGNRWNAYPAFIDIDSDDQVELFIGDQYRTELFEYSDSSFHFQSGMNFGIDIGTNTHVEVTDINNDSLIDIIAFEESTFRHNANMFQKEELNSFDYNIISENWFSQELEDLRLIYAKDLDNNGYTDILVKQDLETYKHFEYINENQLNLISDDFNGIGDNCEEIHVIEDLDNDGLLDILLSSYDDPYNGRGIIHYEQESINSINFNRITLDFCDILLYSNSNFCISDVDNDNLIDYFIITYKPNNGPYELIFSHYEQIDMSSYDVLFVSHSFKGLENNLGTSLVFADLNNDSLDDIIIGQDNGGLKVLKRNQLTLGNFRTSVSEGTIPLQVDFFDNSTPDVISWEWDLDGDGIIDSNEPNPQFVYTQTGLYNVSLRVESAENEDYEVKEDFISVSDTIQTEDEFTPEEINLSIYPNPFNPFTTIKFSIQNDSNIKLIVYNIKGQTIKTLVNGRIKKGDRSYVWEGDDDYGSPVSSGIYYYKLIVNDKTEAIKKCVLLK